QHEILRAVGQEPRGHSLQPDRQRPGDALGVLQVTGVIFHVRFTCASDYNERRLPYRPAHLKQLEKLSSQGRVVGGGPEPDGTYAHIFYRVHDRAVLDRLLGDNEFNRARLFVQAAPRAFVEFLAPLERPPIDTGVRATIVEGIAIDRGRAVAG